ncbi:MAG: hypothetical protein IH820_13265, partial [Bacteroidetes bacterium]|nr:hypothetical protein [Bacteroidota bacterium]
MATTRVNYPSRAVEAARRVMLELVRLLGEYRDDIVVVGGWVPELLFPDADHIGSTDVDLALDHRALQDPGYATVLTLLKSRGYEQDSQQPFIFRRRVEIGGEPVTVGLPGGRVWRHGTTTPNAACAGCASTQGTRLRSGFRTKRLFWILSGGCARGLLAHQSPLARSVAPLRTSQVVLGWAKIPSCSPAHL